MSKTPRVLGLIGGLLVLAGIWPTLQFVNRICPFIFGLPLFVFYMVLLNFLVAAFLLLAFRILE